MITDVTTLHRRMVVRRFFENGTVYLSIILSILYIVFWLIYLFKNNSFKNYYPTKKIDLFKHFMCYFMIFFCGITFYFSHMAGLKTYVALVYPDDSYYKEVDITNQAAVFLSSKIETYSIDEKEYPEPFNELFIEKNIQDFDAEKPHISQLGMNYVFYSLTTKVVNDQEYKIDEYDNAVYPNNEDLSGFVRSETLENGSTIFYYKDTIVNVLPYLPYGNKLSYYNFSSNFYIPEKLDDGRTDYDDILYSSGNYENTQTEREQNCKYVYELLGRNDPKEIKAKLSAFLGLVNKYKVDCNLTAEQWFQLVYHPDDFEVTAFIKTEKPDPREGYVNRTPQRELTEEEEYYKEHVTDYYLDREQLHNTIENIDDVKNQPVFGYIIYVMMVVAYGFCVLLFMFRVTGAKTFIFSVLSIFVISIIIALLGVFASFLIIGDNYNSIGYFITYTTLLFILFFFIMSVLANSRINKIVSGIFVNLSIVGIAVFLPLLLVLISMYQKDYCLSLLSYGQYNHTTTYDCDTIMELLDIYWIPVLLILALLYQWWYAGIIKKWKALPEG